MSLAVILLFVAIGSISMLFKTKYSYIPLLFYFILIIGFRSLDVPDTEPYVLFFQGLNQSSLFDQSFLYEKGFVALSFLIKQLTNNYNYYFAIIAFLNVLLVGYSFKCLTKNEKVKNSKSMLIAYLSYMSFFGFFYNAIVLRAGLAISCLMLILTIRDRRIKVILFILAFLFHRTSLFFIIGYLVFFYAKKKTNKTYFLIGLLLIFIHVSGFPVWFIQYLVGFINQLLDSLSGTDFAKLQHYSKDLLDMKYLISFRLIFRKACSAILQILLCKHSISLSSNFST